MSNRSNEYFETSETTLMYYQYEIYLKNGVIDVVKKIQFQKNLQGGFVIMYVREFSIISRSITDGFNSNKHDEILKEALYHLAKKDVYAFKKLFNILFENDNHQFLIAEQVIKEISQEYTTLLDLPF